MINFRTVTIPVYLSTYMHMGHSSEFTYENDARILLACNFNIRASKGYVASPTLIRAIKAVDLTLYKYLRDLEEQGKEVAFSSFKREFELIKLKNAYMKAEFPSDLNAENALTTDTEICYLYEAGSSEVYFIPANLLQLSKAFIASAHTGALVNIDVDTKTHSSTISLYMPEAKSKSLLNKPKAGIR